MIKNALKIRVSPILGYLVMVFFGVLFTEVVLAQEPPVTSINKIISAINTNTNNLAIEKLYLQTDKAAYTAGDTLWFKAYLFDAAYLNASSKSGLMYIELANDSNRVMKRIMLPVLNGLGMGQMAINEKDFPQGAYELRAYTNWMRNFGENHVFKKIIYINSTTGNDWLIDYSVRVTDNTAKDNFNLYLKLNQLNNNAVGLREIAFTLNEGKKTFFKSDIQTDINGTVNIRASLPEKATYKNITASLQDMRKGGGNRKLTIPLILNRTEFTDLQFMPEGGYLVAGLPARIAFKAIAEDGTGADVAGKVFNSQLQQVAEFKSAQKGMGSFNLTPKQGEVYTAQVLLPDGSSKTYPLPAVKSSGTTLTINNTFRSDSCEIMIRATPDVAALGNNYYLIGQGRGVASYGAAISFNTNEVKLMASKKIFPGGIIRFTLCRADKTVLNERIIFIDQSDELNIQVTQNKPVYRQRDSVALSIKVTNKAGVPVQGSFSVSVTDDGLVKTDSVASRSILTHMLLTSDLKGNVEDPGHYLPAANASIWQQLDDLLLTQGWVGYEWTDVFKPARVLTYAAEQEFLVKGRVTNMLNKPVTGSGVTLLSKKPLLVKQAVTDAQGIFSFEGIVPADTAVFFIQSRNKNDKSYNVGIEMDEFKPPVFSLPGMRTLPWYVNTDTGGLALVKKQVGLKKELERITGSNMLKEIVITGKKVIKDSKNLNGPGNADVTIDEAELEKAGKMTLGDLLYKNIKGFGLRTIKNKSLYTVVDLHVHLIIDGINVEMFLPDGIPLYQQLKYYFDYYDAEEIKGIELMKSGGYTLKYTSSYLDVLTSAFYNEAFIEVTTRSGHGPFVKKTPGTFLYRPIPLTLPVKFYAPKYKPGSAADMTDIRSTIYWEPDIITNAKGEATVSFYTADNPGRYSLMIEGADMKGGVGVKRAAISIEKVKSKK